jgi:hypothetical protein
MKPRHLALATLALLLCSLGASAQGRPTRANASKKAAAEAEEAPTGYGSVERTRLLLQKRTRPVAGTAAGSVERRAALEGRKVNYPKPKPKSKSKRTRR